MCIGQLIGKARVQLHKQLLFSRQRDTDFAVKHKFLFLFIELSYVNFGSCRHRTDFDVQVKKTHRRRYFMKFMPENISEKLKNVKLNSYNKAMFAA